MEAWLTGLRTELQDIAHRVDTPGGAERDGLKRDIIALFKRVDGALTDLSQLKEEIRGLVERFKQAGSAAENTASPAPTIQAFILLLRINADSAGRSRRQNTWRADSGGRAPRGSGRGSQRNVAGRTRPFDLLLIGDGRAPG